MTRNNADLLFQIELDVVKFQRLLVSDSTVTYDDYKRLYLTCNEFVKSIENELRELYKKMVVV